MVLIWAMPLHQDVIQFTGIWNSISSQIHQIFWVLKKNLKNYFIWATISLPSCVCISNLIVPKVGREASSCNSSTGDAKPKGSSLAPVQSELQRKGLLQQTQNKHKKHMKTFPSGLYRTEDDAYSSDKSKHHPCFLHWTHRNTDNT